MLKRARANNEHSTTCWVTNRELNAPNNEEREKGREKERQTERENDREREKNAPQFACISFPWRAGEWSQVDLNRISIDLCLVYSMHVKSVFTPRHYPDILPAETV